MTTSNALKLHPSHGGAVAPRCWKLAPGRAISLQPHEASVLRIAKGQVWATLNVPHQGHGNESGDHFLQTGQRLDVRAGQHLVIEPWAEVGEAPVYFEWTPVFAAVSQHASRWNASVTQPLHDLGLALLMAGSALGRLVKASSALSQRFSPAQTVARNWYCTSGCDRHGNALVIKQQAGVMCQFATSWRAPLPPPDD